MPKSTRSGRDAPKSKRELRWAKRLSVTSQAKRIENTLAVAAQVWGKLEDSSTSKASRVAILKDLRNAINDGPTATRIVSLGSLDDDVRDLVVKLTKGLESTDSEAKKRTTGFSWTHLLILGRLRHSNPGKLNSVRHKLLKKSAEKGWSSGRFSEEVRNWNEQHSDQVRVRKASRIIQLTKDISKQASTLKQSLSLLEQHQEFDAVAKVNVRDLWDADDCCEGAIGDLDNLKADLSLAMRALSRIRKGVQKRIDQYDWE